MGLQTRDLRDCHRETPSSDDVSTATDCMQGHVVATSPAYSHRLPHVFSRPDEFDPERFAAPREEDKAAPFSFIGFGGGRHGCMGSNFAILQVTIYT